MINEGLFVGHAGRDADIKYFESGKCKATVSIAVNRRGKDLPPDWINLEAWDKTAEILAKYVKKGSLIDVETTLKFDVWNDRETGEERSKAVFHIDRLTLLGKAGESSQSDADYGDYDDDF